MKLIQTMLAPAILCITLLAQEAPTTTVGTGGGQARAAKVRSPEVLADGRVTVRLLAPKATEVLVQGNWEGGRGLAGTALLASNIAILVRLALLSFAIAEAGWDAHRRGAAMSEFANEISWLLVSLAWLVRHP